MVGVISLMLSEDLINEISRLQVEHKMKARDDDMKNPVSGLVTPEWYYSDSIRIFSDLDINWDSKQAFAHGINRTIMSPRQDGASI